MTARERAMQAFRKGMRVLGQEAYQGVAIDAIEHAIIAAVLEEREACLQIIADEYDGIRDTVIGIYGPPMLKVEEKIRARNNGGEE